MPRRRPRATALLREDAAYLAGLLDARGHLYFRARGEARRPLLRVTAQDAAYLDELRGLTGLGAVVRSGTSFQWVIEGADSIGGLLKQVQPYMRLPHQQGWQASIDEPAEAEAVTPAPACLICGEPVRARHLCPSHYVAARRLGLLQPPVHNGCSLCGAGSRELQHFATAEPVVFLCGRCHSELSAVRRRRPAGSAVSGSADASAEDKPAADAYAVVP